MRGGVVAVRASQKPIEGRCRTIPPLIPFLRLAMVHQSRKLFFDKKISLVGPEVFGSTENGSSQLFRRPSLSFCGHLKSLCGELGSPHSQMLLLLTKQK